MGARRLKFVVIICGVALSMAMLIVVGMSGSGGYVYYLTVSEFLDRGDQETRGYRVNGKVVSGTIERLPTGQDVRFRMHDGAQSLDVSFHGIIPDTFVDDADVVVEGRRQADGVFVAHTLLAKCPSKYESADAADADPPAGAEGYGAP